MSEELFEYPSDQKKPIQNDAQIADMILEVIGKVGEDKKIQVTDKDGKKLIKVSPKPNPFYEIFDKDMTISNLSSIEHGLVKDHINLSNFTQAVSDGIGVDLSKAQKFFRNQLKGTLISSRGKAGWAGWLSKTSKQVSEESIENYVKQMEERRKKGFFGRLFGGGET